MAIFDTFYGFFAVYVPLVALAVAGIMKEDKLIAFEQKLKRKLKKWANPAGRLPHGERGLK